MAGWTHGPEHGQLTVTVGALTVDLMDKAWRCTNLLEVDKVVVRGSSRQIPTRPGRRSRKRIIDEMTAPIEMRFRSDCTPAGAVWDQPSRAAQLAYNLRQVRPIAFPVDDHDGASFVYTSHDGEEFTANGWIEGWDQTRLGLVAAAVGFDLVIPDGVWTPVP